MNDNKQNKQCAVTLFWQNNKMEDGKKYLNIHLYILIIFIYLIIFKSL